MQILLMLFLHIYLVFLLAFNSRVFGVSFDENISVTENSLVPLTETSVRVLPFNHTYVLEGISSQYFLTVTECIPNWATKRCRLNESIFLGF